MSPDWENALQTIDEYAGAGPIYSQACIKYTCPSNDPTTPSALLRTITRNSNDGLGTAVKLGDIDGDGIPDIIVGAPNDSTVQPNAGAVYIYSGANGQLLRTLQKTTPVADDHFGAAVSFFDIFKVILVGAPGDSTMGAGVGRVYVYDVNGGQVLAIDEPFSPVPGAGFGSSIATTGQRAPGTTNLVIGAPFEQRMGQPAQAGNAYPFDFEVQFAQSRGRLTSPMPNPQDWFGYSVAIGGPDPKMPNILVGAPGAPGAATPGTTFEYDSFGNLLRTISNPTPVAGDQFGWAIDSFFDITYRIDITAPNDDTAGGPGTQTGAVYEYDSLGNLVRTTLPPTPTPQTKFGSALSVVGNRILVGAPGAFTQQGPGSGAVYYYDSPGRLVRTFTGPVLQRGSFGTSVAGIDSGPFTSTLPVIPYLTFVGVGSPANPGTVYLYQENQLRISCAGSSNNCKVVQSTGNLFPGTQNQIPVEIVALSLTSVSPLQTTGTQMALTVICDRKTMDPALRCSSLYVDGNVWGATRESQTKDPFIIVNGEPFFFLRWHWWDPINSVIVVWDYWWNDSHNHPNWYWGVYWWWRTYVNYYLGTWLPWWWWWWHWTYWQYWYWWSTEFPYA